MKVQGSIGEASRGLKPWLSNPDDLHSGGRDGKSVTSILPKLNPRAWLMSQ